MILVLQFLALGVCFVSTAVRTPAAWRGQGLPVWTCFALMTVAVALSIGPIYDVVDGVLGHAHVANVILRMALFIVFCTLGKALTQAFDSMHVEWLVSGRPGLWALGFSMGLTIAAFILGGGAGGDMNSTTPAGLVYGMTWRFYLAYVAMCLLRMLLPVAFDPRRSDLYRWAAILQAAGFVLVFVMPFSMSAVLLGGGEETAVKLISQLSILFVAAGLGLVWLAARRHRAAAAREITAA